MLHTPDEAFEIYVANKPLSRDSELKNLLYRITQTSITTPWVRKMLIILRYFMEVEKLTSRYEFLLKLTKTGKVPAIKKFMESWGKEEIDHSILIEKIIKQSGINVESDWYETRVASTPFGYNFNHFVIIPLLSFLFPRTFRGTHMLWGALNERFAIEGYGQLKRHVVENSVQMSIEESSLLVDIFSFIKAEEARHLKFYADCAHYYLNQSKLSQVISRFFLKAWWDIVGSGIMPSNHTDNVLETLFSGKNGESSIAKMTNWLIRFPGMTGFSLRSVLVKRKRIKI